MNYKEIINNYTDKYKMNIPILSLQKNLNIIYEKFLIKKFLKHSNKLRKFKNILKFLRLIGFI